MKTNLGRIAAATIILAAASMLTACAPAAPTPTSTASAGSATPIAAATTAASATPTAAATVPLTCDSIISSDALSAALGTTVAPDTQPIDDVSLSPLVFNGINCYWSGTGSAYVDLVVLGANSGLKIAKDETDCFGATVPTPKEDGECILSNSAGQYWLTGYIATAGKGINATATKAVNAVTAGFAAAAATAEPPAAPAAQTGVWPVVSCKKLSAAGKVSQALGQTLTAQDEDNSGGPIPAGYVSSIEKAGLTACDWNGGAANFNSLEFPGAGALESVITDVKGVTTVPLPGGAPAYLVPVDGQTDPDIWFFDQPNLVIISGYVGVTQNNMERAALALATEYTAS